MEFDFGIAGVTAITVICYLVAAGIKATPLDNKWLPLICGLLGGVLGVAGMFAMPEFPTHDIMSSVAVGIVSGLAATGIDQVYKQLTPKTNKEGE